MSARMTVFLLLTAGCATAPDATPRRWAMAKLEFQWFADEKPWDVHFTEVMFFPGQVARLVDDAHQLPIKRVPGEVDSWVFSTQQLCHHDAPGDTVTSWVVVLRLPAGTRPARDVNRVGEIMDLEVGLETQCPPTERFRFRAPNTGSPYQGDTLRFEFEKYPRRGVLTIRFFNGPPGSVTLE